jgi:hypothetical protein
MANTNAPFGFALSAFLPGFTPNYAPSVRRIASNNATAIYCGDPVTALNTGYITRSTAGTTSIEGILLGVKYLSTTQQRTVWRNYWPGSDATGDVEAYVIDSPNALFRAQAGGSTTAIGFADIGSGINFALGTGNTATGISGAYADQTTIATTSTLPFRIVKLVRDPPGANGTDIASAYNHVILAFNFQDFRGTTLV